VTEDMADAILVELRAIRELLAARQNDEADGPRVRPPMVIREKGERHAA
jgi:hypothetical protein